MNVSSFLRRIRRRLTREEGWVLVTAMILMATMLSMGLATFAYVDGQQSQSGAERQKDTAFNLAETAMNATAFSLSNTWPGAGSSSTPFPTCTQASTDSRCPTPGTMAGLVVGPDAGNVSWQVNVYDNGINGQGQSSATWYSDAITPAQPSYDANGDGKVWIRSQATVNGNTRVLVEQVQVQLVPVNLPHDVVLAGSLQAGNNGNKVLIDTQGSSLTPSTVQVRCNRNTDATCLVYRQGSQLSPDTTCDNVCNASAPTTAISSSAIAGLKSQAKANGTFYTTCPANLPTSFTVLWIDGPDNCSYTGNATINSSTSPGLLIMNNGTFQLGGTVTFYGVIYALNAQGSSSDIAPLVETFGDANVFGGILVDGGGNVEVASSHTNLTYADNAFSNINTNGTAAPLQNTFRQIPH
jgi:Tfp pilus assembly protein PilX